MKKLFTLIAFLAVVMGAKAAEVEINSIDFSTFKGYPHYVMGYVPEWIDGVMTDFGANFRYATDADMEDGKDGALKEGESIVGTVTTNNGTVYNKVQLPSAGWHQYFIITGTKTEFEGNYKLTAMIKASEPCNLEITFQKSDWSGGAINTTAAVGTEWQEVEWEFNAVQGTSMDAIAKPAGNTATIEWKWIKITQDQREQRPVEWVENLVNGDASGEYGEVPCAQQIYKPVDMEIAAASGDEIAAIVKTTPIIELDGEKVFACETPAVDKSAYTTNVKGEDVKNNYAWANQFFIVSPVAFKEGETIKVSFDYKAKEPANTNTQAHGMPTRYQDWQLLGDVKFTTEWQHLEKEVTLSAAQAGANGMYSVAFNLNPDNQNANTFYFKNLSVMTMKLDNGFFVASTSAENSIDYDFDNAVELVYDEAEDALKAVVGTVGKKDSWVNEIMISTVRGNDKAFRNKTIKPKTVLTNEDWINYEAGSNAKIKLPAAGVYEVYVAETDMQMMVRQLEGEEIVKPIEIVPNPTEIKLEGAARISADWDNQLWIFANRLLEEGEETVIEFDYVGSLPEAKTGTQCQGLFGAGQFDYLHWACIGDVVFTNEVQHISKPYKVAAEAAVKEKTLDDGTVHTYTNHGIVFNMACIEEACTYTIKNVVWKTADGSESLIDMEEGKNFWIKSAGGAPQQITPDGIQNIVADKAASNALYNLAGQRVSKSFKGVAVKNGQKFIVK